MSSEERRSLWHSAIESVSIPEDKPVMESNCYLTVFLDWSLLHQVYNHKKATVARYRMLSTMKSIFVNINYSSLELNNPHGPTLGFPTLDSSISAAVTISNRIANTNQQYSIPLPAKVIYLYKKDDVITEEFKDVLTRSVRSVGIDLPVVGYLDYVQEKREKDPRGIFYLNIKDSVALAHVQEERLAPKTRFRPKEQIVYDGPHYLMLSTKTENSKSELLSLGSLAVHDYKENVEISVWETEDNLRQYLLSVQSGTYTTALVNDLYSYESSKGIVYCSKYLNNLFSMYSHVHSELHKNILVESFTLPYLVLEGEPQLYKVEKNDLVYFRYGQSTKVTVDVVPSTSIDVTSTVFNGQELTYHSPVELSPQLDLQTFISSGLAEVLSRLDKIDAKLDGKADAKVDAKVDVSSTSNNSSPSVESSNTTTTQRPPVIQPDFVQVQDFQHPFHELPQQLPQFPKVHIIRSENVNPMSMDDILKLLIPPPMHVHQTSNVTESFEHVHENTTPKLDPGHIGCIRLPSMNRDFAPIHLDVPSDSESDPEDDDDDDEDVNVQNTKDNTVDPLLVSNIVENILNPNVSLPTVVQQDIPSQSEPEITAVVLEVPVEGISDIKPLSSVD